MKNIIVVGAGPAGIMAAITAAAANNTVYLVERNLGIGKKLLLTGNSRCNFTNTASLDEFLASYEKNGKFLRDALNSFSNTDLIDFFKRRSLGVKKEDSRVFPATERAESVLEVLEEELKKKKVKVLLGSTVTKILKEDNTIKGVELNGSTKLLCSAIIIATGGISYKGTGSTGDGIKFAEELGHTIIPLSPGLVPLEVIEKYPGRIEGLSLEKVDILVMGDKKKNVAKENGDIIFTRRGISGPAVFLISAAVSELIRKGKKVSIKIDFFPKFNDEKMKEVFINTANYNSSKSIKNTLKELLPERLVVLFLEILRIDTNKKMNQVTAQERNSLIALFKGFKLGIKGTRPIQEAMVTRGGVSLKEIDPKTMASRIIDGLYFAGEVIDIAGKTGGFNIQAAFSTGHLAGETAQRNS